MTKIINKIFYILKNIMLPILMLATIYIVIYMFRRLEKQVFGADFLEFLGVVAPFLILLILWFINAFMEHDTVRNSLFYNLTSFLAMLTITYFCYRALFDQNMFMWHKYAYKINFNYFSDQIAPIKVMLYVLAFADIILVIIGYLNKEKSEKVVKNTRKKSIEINE